MTTRINVLFLLLAAVFLLTGCAKILSAGAGFGGITGINERVVLINEITGNAEDAEYRVCAEPSPDATQTAFAEAKINARKYAEASINIGLDQEYIGLRTQTIQLLRDAMYRACEAFLSGGINTTQYSLLLRRHQRYMISLLAVESLTGTIRADSPLASLDRSLARVSSSITKTETDIKQLEEDDKLDAAIKAEKKAELKNLRSYRKTIINEIGPVSENTKNSTETNNHSTQVVAAVTEIVEHLTSNDDVWSECFAYLKLPKDQFLDKEEDRLSDALSEACFLHISNTSRMQTELAQLAKQARLEQLEQQAQLKQLKQQLKQELDKIR